jgi:hypothetical protein
MYIVKPFKSFFCSGNQFQFPVGLMVFMCYLPKDGDKNEKTGNAGSLFRYLKKQRALYIKHFLFCSGYKALLSFSAVQIITTHVFLCS